MARRVPQMIVDGKFAQPSKVEKTVAEWFDANGIEYEAQVKLGYRIIDFRVGETYIEVNGCYWHGCIEHFPLQTAAQTKRAGRDKGLATYCKKRSIPLLVIWEHDVRVKCFDALADLLPDK